MNSPNLIDMIDQQFLMSDEMQKCMDLVKPYQILSNVFLFQAKSCKDKGNQEEVSKFEELYNLINKQAFIQLINPSTDSNKIPLYNLVNYMKYSSIDKIKEALEQAEKDAGK